jgi:hypothetical protein
VFSASIDQQLVDLYRAWDALEKQSHENSILDFDLASPRTFAPVRDRYEVLETLERLILEIAPQKTSIADLTRARLQASLCYLRSLLGENINFESYVEQTLCLKPEFFDEDFVRQQRERVEQELWDKLHLRFHANQAHRFDSLLYVADPNALRNQFEYFRSRWLPELLEHVPIPLDEYEVRVEFASEDAYWKNWISGNLSKHKILLRVNIHPRQIWYLGFSEILVIHEYCGHAVQMINWHRQIETGQLPQFMGILTVHFPDQFMLEGLAESLSYFLPTRMLRLEPTSIVLRELHRYYLRVLNNVHMIANGGANDEAFDYAMQHLPFTRPENVKKEIQDRTQNILFRGYQYVYGVAKESFLKSLSRFDSFEMWNTLRFIYDTPMTAKQFRAALDHSKQRRRGKHGSYRQSDYS